MTDKQRIYSELLVLRCRQGNKQAFEELISCWQDKLLYYIRRLVDNEQDAWQLLQQVWVVVLRNIGGIRQPEKFPAWLYSIARNLVLNHLRSKYSQKSFLEEYKGMGNNESENCAAVFDNAEQVHYGLGKVSLPQREVLTLFFFQDLSLDEIAQVLQLPVGTVKSRLHYAKQALRNVLKEETKNG